MPLVFSSGWASGVNAYLVVLVLGLADRFGDVADIPDVLGSVPVLLVAGGLYAVEFVADKVPYLDSTWDVVSTVIRPTAGAVIAVLLAGDATSLEQAVYAVVGGGTALASHTVKAGIRLGVNTSPEPFTNIGLSSLEDLTVAGVMVLALTHPWVALGVAALLLVTGMLLVVLVFHTLRRAWRGRRGRPATSRGAAPS